jgi:HK97 family phage portal protein
VSTAIGRPLPWYTRMGSWIRALVFDEPTQDEFSAGSDFGDDHAAHKVMDVQAGMSAAARFPWVFAAVNARSTDLASLPLRAYNANGDEVTDHPLLNMAKPNSGETWTQIRTQLYADRTLSGDAYLLSLAGVGGAPAAVVRMLPARVKPIASDWGWPEGYEYDGMGQMGHYDASVVAHVRGFSWENGPAATYGLSPIQALLTNLKSEQALDAFELNAFKRGRVDVVISPSDKTEPIGPKQVKDIKRDYERVSAHGGALINGQGLDVKPLALSPRDVEGEKRREINRYEVLAALSVPPSRVGLPGANYATERQQMKTYWQTLKGDARLFDDGLTKIGQLFPGYESVEIRHDFSGVEALQLERTERLQRVTSHILNGVPASEAYQIEGFEGVEVEVIQMPTAAPVPGNDEEPDEPAERGPALAFSRWWLKAAVAEHGVPVAEADRAALWSGFIKRLHEPHEKRMARHLSTFLRQQIRRITTALATALEGNKSVQRIASDTIMAQVFDLVREDALLRAAIGPLWEAAARDGHGEVARALPINLTFDPDRAAVARLVSDVSTTITTTTAQQIRHIIEGGLEQNLTVEEIQQALMRSPGFSASRAAMIARTETTAAIETGSEAAYKAAADAGVDIRKQWLSARDGSVRDAHVGLDGQIREIGEDFEDQDGATGPGPGQMSTAASSVNCRCTTIPLVGEESA